MNEVFVTHERVFTDLVSPNRYGTNFMFDLLRGLKFYPHLTKVLFFKEYHELFMNVQSQLQHAKLSKFSEAEITKKFFELFIDF